MEARKEKGRKGKERESIGTNRKFASVPPHSATDHPAGEKRTAGSLRFVDDVDVTSRRHGYRRPLPPSDSVKIGASTPNQVGVIPTSQTQRPPAFSTER